MSRRWILGVPVLLGGLGCGQEELPGQYWDITVQATDNECTANGIGYNEQFEYRVEIDGNNAIIAVHGSENEDDDDVFATGTLDGCNLSYTSTLYTSYPDQSEVKWQITGAAQVNVGGAGNCVDEQGLDWAGTEQINFNASAHPAIQPGCLYRMDVTGSWVREVKVEE